MQVQEIMSQVVHSCAPEDSLKQAAQLMWDHDCGSLPVSAAEDGSERAIGVITDRDICMCALFQDRRLSELRVRDVMAEHNVLSCRPSDSIEQAEALMRQGRVRRLPVVDEKGSLAGIISLADLARAAKRESGKPEHSQIERQIIDMLAAVSTPRGQSLLA